MKRHASTRPTISTCHCLLRPASKSRRRFPHSICRRRWTSPFNTAVTSTWCVVFRTSEINRYVGQKCTLTLPYQMDMISAAVSHTCIDLDLTKLHIDSLDVHWIFMRYVLGLSSEHNTWFVKFQVNRIRNSEKRSNTKVNFLNIYLYIQLWAR